MPTSKARSEKDLQTTAEAPITEKGGTDAPRKKTPLAPHQTPSPMKIEPD